MKSTEMLNQIKTLLNIEVKLEEMKLENGTIVSAESFEKDKEIFIVTDDEKVAMPVGEYLLEDGRLVVVEEEGKIADVREVSDEVPAKEEASDDKEITEDLAEEEEKEEEKEEMGYATKEELAEVKSMIDEIKAMLDPKEEMSEESSEEVIEEKVEMSKEVQEQLSEPASKPIKHNPEGESKQMKKVEFGKGKFTSTLDRVLNKLNK
tara:strand:- start:457 stop:1077 length:621 start_codon:yes stop_codon:yes gene_type:complete